MVRNARSRAQRQNARNRAARRAQEFPEAVQDEAAVREERRERHNRVRR